MNELKEYIKPLSWIDRDKLHTPVIIKNKSIIKSREHGINIRRITIEVNIMDTNDRLHASKILQDEMEGAL